MWSSSNVSRNITFYYYSYTHSVKEATLYIFFSPRIFTRMWPLSHTFIHIRVDKNTMRIKSLIIKNSDHSNFATSHLSCLADTVVVLKTVTVLGHFQKKVKNLQMEADRLELIARHKFAPSNRPRLFARPMRVQIVLGARLYPAWFTHGRWPVPFRAAGLRGRRNRR